MRVPGLLSLIITCLLFSSAFAKDDDFQDFAELDLEVLLNTTVISASKREQKLSEAPKYNGSVSSRNFRCNRDL